MNAPNGKEEGKIDHLREEIYQRDFEARPLSPHQNLSRESFDVNKEWQHDPIQETEVHAPKIIAGTFFKKILIFAIIFFVLSAGIFLYMFFGGGNMVTANKVDITFLGPVTVSAGNELDFNIVINNQNRLAIENATLYIDYPDGTKNSDDITQDLLHGKFLIGEIDSQGTYSTTSRSVQFGELNAHRQIKVKIEYGLKNSNATYHKEKVYDVTISSTPLTMNVSHPQEVVSNDVVEYKATITSNSSVSLDKLMVKADYPFGFAFIDADPQPTYDNSKWVIPTLKPGETQTITLRGRVQGEQGDERVVKFSLGAQSTENEKLIATQYLSQMESVFLKKPPLALSLSLEGSTTPQFTTEQGTVIHGQIDIINNLPVQVVNAQVVLSLGGRLYDPASVAADRGGFYQSIDNKILWNKTTDDRLASLDPGERVSLVFAFSTLPSSVVALKNGSMSLNASVTGSRVTDGNMLQTVATSQQTTILARTSIGLISRSVYSVGPFRNRGPVPPKADVKTTYTVIWTATNSLNDARGAEVRATLPVNVKWLGVVSPQSETVTWNQDKNEVVWRIGSIVAGAGGSKPAREVAFQVELVPSRSQVGAMADLVLAPTMTATDSFTNTVLSAVGRDLTTRLSTDPAYNGSEALVTR